MSTTPVHCERRAAQRFDFHLPVLIGIAGGQSEGHGFTQDLSGRGILLYTDFAVAEGDQLELTLRMPSEITLGESMRVRCRGRVTRVSALQTGGKSAVAVYLQKYEYLPENEVAAARDYGRVSSLHEDTPSDEAGMTAHTFEWRGSTPLVPH